MQTKQANIILSSTKIKYRDHQATLNLTMENFNYLKIIMIFLNYMMVIKVIKHIDSLVY